MKTFFKIFIFMCIFQDIVAQKAENGKVNNASDSKITIEIIKYTVIKNTSVNIKLRIANRSNATVGFWHPSSPLGQGSIKFSCNDKNGDEVIFYNEFKEWFDGGRSQQVWLSPKAETDIEIGLGNWICNKTDFVATGNEKFTVSGELFLIK